MNKIVHYIIFISIVIVLYACGEKITNKSTLPSLTETYSRSDKNPFGASIAYNVVKSAFGDYYLQNIKQPFYKFHRENSTYKSLYFSITKSQYTSDEDEKYMLRYANNGNDLFIVSRYFDSTLLNAANVTEISDGYSPFFSFFGVKEMNDTKVTLAPKYYSDTSLKQYFYFPFSSSFQLKQNSKAKILSYNEMGKPNCIVVFYGKGRIFLHCDPRAFSNYYLLKDKNIKELTSLLGYTKNNFAYIYWDDFYRTRTHKPESDANSDAEPPEGLSFLLSKPPLAWAFWLSILLLLLYILFGGKRKQRIVEERKQNINHSVNFAETIGLLYLQNKNNRSIADKMILYFNDFVRNNYYLNTNQINDEFISSLSRKSGVPYEQVDKLYNNIKLSQNNYDIDDYKLLALNQHIQNFYKKIQ